jgi:SAM-dependent methyltransferase
VSPPELSANEAERLRAFERQGHDALAESYHAFFSSVTALATNPLIEAVRLQPASRLLDVASGPGALTAETANRGACPVGVDLSPKMVPGPATAPCHRIPRGRRRASPIFQSYV